MGSFGWHIHPHTTASLMAMEQGRVPQRGSSPLPLKQLGGKMTDFRFTSKAQILWWSKVTIAGLSLEQLNEFL